MCGDLRCVRPGACPPDANGTDWDTIDKLCYTSGAGGCPAGQSCDASGTCVADPIPCTSHLQCGSKSCWVPTNETVGVCCNEACYDDCQECSTGTCKARTGLACPDPVPCNAVSHVSALLRSLSSQYLKGFAPNGACQRFASPLLGVCNAAVRLTPGCTCCDLIPCFLAGTVQYGCAAVRPTSWCHSAHVPGRWLQQVLSAIRTCEHRIDFYSSVSHLDTSTGMY